MIGGNVTAKLQVKQITKTAIGEVTNDYQTIQTLIGYLDYTGGNAEYKTIYKGKLEETTHVFLCDYTNISVDAAKCRLVIRDKIYSVLLIDDPMELHKHLEIFLKYNEVVK